MNFQKLKNFSRFVKSFLPSKLPVGKTEFDVWASDIIALAGAPDNDSFRFALATMVLHTPANRFHAPKRSFVIEMKKGMANEVASFVMHEMKRKQLERVEQEKQAKEAQNAVGSTEEVPSA